jgi:hypothetical protein
VQTTGQKGGRNEDEELCVGVSVVCIATYITHLLVLSKVYEHRHQVRLQILNLYCLNII